VTEWAVKFEASLAGGRQEETAAFVEDFARLTRRIEAGASTNPPSQGAA
jgi:hypothetical protein